MGMIQVFQIFTPASLAAENQRRIEHLYESITKLTWHTAKMDVAVTVICLICVIVIVIVLEKSHKKSMKKLEERLNKKLSDSKIL